MKTFQGLFVVAFFLVLKIIFNLNKEFLGRNFFRLDDIVNLLIILFILIFIYKNKERFVQNESTDRSRFFFIVIISSVIFHFYRTFINLPYSFLHSDNVISILHINRMIHFNSNVYESTWNEHTTLLIYLQKYVMQLFKVLGLNDNLLNYLIVFSLFTLFSSIMLSKLLTFFTDYKAVSYVIGALYFIDSIGAGNRVLRFDTRSFGSLIMISFLYFFYKFTKSKYEVNLHITVVIGTLAIFNLESYSITVLVLFLTFLIVEKPDFKILGRLFGTFFSTISVIALFHFLTDQLNDLLNLNVLFHLQSSRENGVNLLNAISGVEFFPGLNLYLAIFLIWPLFLFKHRDYLKNKNIIYLNSYLIGEVIHLILTGPRWIAYGQIIRIPLMIVLCVLLDRYLIKLRIHRSFKNFKYQISTSLLLPVVFTSFIGGPLIFDQKIERQKEILLEESLRKEITYLVGENTDNEAYFLWTENKNWSWMFLNSNYLPATRMWLWVQAYAENKSYFSWDDKWGLEKIQKYWLEDIETEKINIFVIDKNFINLPNFISQYISENSVQVKCVQSFCLYKNKN